MTGIISIGNSRKSDIFRNVGMQFTGLSDYLSAWPTARATRTSGSGVQKCVSVCVSVCVCVCIAMLYTRLYAGDLKWVRLSFSTSALVE